MGAESSTVNDDTRGKTGDLPGLEVGSEYHNKCEMQVLGMHRKWLSGIDYVPAPAAEDGVSYATAVVSSGGYEDDAIMQHATSIIHMWSNWQNCHPTPRL